MRAWHKLALANSLQIVHAWAAHSKTTGGRQYLLCCNDGGQRALAATGAGGREYLLSCNNDGQSALAARRAPPRGQQVQPNRGSKAPWRLGRCTSVADAFSIGRRMPVPAHRGGGCAAPGPVSPTRPPCGLARFLRGGWVGQSLERDDDGQGALAATGVGGREYLRSCDNGGQSALAARRAPMKEQMKKPPPSHALWAGPYFGGSRLSFSTRSCQASKRKAGLPSRHCTAARRPSRVARP